MRYIIFIVVFIASLFVAANYGFQHMTTDVVVATVTDKERVCSSSDDSIECKYLVFTEEETFQNTDTMMHWKFNSADIQGSIRVGETYTFYVYGWRIPVMSTFRNIYKVEATE